MVDAGYYIFLKDFDDITNYENSNYIYLLFNNELDKEYVGILFLLTIFMFSCVFGFCICGFNEKKKIKYTIVPNN